MTVGKSMNDCWSSCRALLFDKDGTIINFRLMWLGWCREVIGALSSACPAEVVEKNLDAWGVDLALGRIDPGGYLAIGTTCELEESLAECLAAEGYVLDKKGPNVLDAMQHAYRAVEEKKLVRPIEGVAEAIKELYRRGYLLAVVTTDDTDKAAGHLRAVGLDAYFEVILGCDRVTQCKPAPDLALEACRLLGVKPSEVAVIGDTVADMQMGKSAGAACCIGVASGVTDPETLALEADIVLESAAKMI